MEKTIKRKREDATRKAYEMCKELYFLLNDSKNDKIPYIILEDLRSKYKTDKLIFRILQHENKLIKIKNGYYKWNHEIDVSFDDVPDLIPHYLTYEEIDALFYKYKIEKQLTVTNANIVNQEIDNVEKEADEADEAEQVKEQLYEEQEAEDTIYQEEVLKMDKEYFNYSYSVMLELIKSGATTLEKAPSVAVNMVKELKSNFN